MADNEQFSEEKTQTDHLHTARVLTGRRGGGVSETPETISTTGLLTEETKKKQAFYPPYLINRAAYAILRECDGCPMLA